ncbi:MAG TPA: class II fumarate hydratase, partial [Gammaproteobacteria bacterium]|nr:class II fumarate hydratase [Gammaproteobacteria bacterium]
SGWAAQIHFAIQQLKNAAETLLPLALGGTAVGTGLNAHPSFAELVCDQLASITELQFHPAPNRFAALASHEPLLQVSSALKITASALMKIANDVRWLGSGPYCGLGELTLPANEPGSSIMPGK